MCHSPFLTNFSHCHQAESRDRFVRGVIFFLIFRFNRIWFGRFIDFFHVFTILSTCISSWDMNVPIEYTPGSLTVCPSKRDHFKRKGIVFRSFFRGYVKFRGCGVNEYPLGFTNISPGNQWVGILISFWGPGLFSGANLLLILGSVHYVFIFPKFHLEMELFLVALRRWWLVEVTMGIYTTYFLRWC